MLIHTLVITWYARHGHDQDALTARRNREPWYTTKTGPCFEDMLPALHRTMITARISRVPGKTRRDVLAAWHAAAA